MEKNYAKLFKNISNLLTKRDFFQNYLFNTKHFTRKRSLPFQTVVLLVLRLLKSSLQTELKGYYTEVFKQDEVTNWVSDAALSKARQKIKCNLFVDLSDTAAGAFYSLVGGERWKGYRLLAVDGSEINLPSSKQLLKDFGKHHTNSVGTKIPQARVSFLTDVLNKITIDASIESFRIGEQSMLAGHLNCVEHTDLLTADANYGHFWVLKKVAVTGADYCFRINKSSDFVKGFIASGMKDVVLDWHPSKGTRASCRKNNTDQEPMKVRLVLIELENETEILVTSLLDQRKFTYSDMQGLYNTRWAVEEEFKKFMQRLVVECFSSLKTNGIRQDFHANVFMLNVVSLLTYESNKKVFQNSKKLKFRRSINWTSALGDIRQRFVLLFLRTKKKVECIIESLMKSFEVNTEPIKPNRCFKRDKRKKGARKKAFICYKPAW